MAYAEKRGKGEYPWRVKFKRPDGTEDSASGFRTKSDALAYGRDQEADVRAGRYHDPRQGDVTLHDYFWKTWLPVQRIGDKTRNNREGEFRAHLEPRWGGTPIKDIASFDVLAFEKELRDRRSKSTADNVMELLRFMMDDALFANMIRFSPVRPKERRGQKEPKNTREGVVTTLPNVLSICGRLKPNDALMVLSALFTGMRWGEVAGMRRQFLHLTPAAGRQRPSGYYVIDPLAGALHQLNGKRWFGPPKNGKGRMIELPPFLAELLLTYLATFPSQRDVLFVNSRGNLHDRSHFRDRWWRPACDGWPSRERTQGHPALFEAPAIHTGLWFHDLRHTHKTWLADDGVDPIARDERLGHATPGMDGVYIHATPAMRKRILTALESRWKGRPEVDLPFVSHFRESEQLEGSTTPAS